MKNKKCLLHIYSCLCVCVYQQKSKRYIENRQFLNIIMIIYLKLFNLIEEEVEI